MIGLGLALAQPSRRIAVITGDGEMLMGLGALATVGRNARPISRSLSSITASMAKPACSRATRKPGSISSAWRLPAVFRLPLMSGMRTNWRTLPTG